MTKYELLTLLKLCLQSNIFKYNDEIYKQITGTPMGSPISVLIAEIVMQNIETTIFENIPC